MITIEELKQIKEMRKTELYYEEKEYFQYIFLNEISKYPKEFVFKGGTCLRIGYGLERASEDLDFSTQLKPAEIKKIIEKCLKIFDKYGIEYEIYAIKEHKNNIRIETRFNGPLYKGNKVSTNTLKLDFNHQKVKHKSAKIINKLFSDVPLFTILVLEEKELLTEKIRALINRSEPKDLYDIWALINKGTELDTKLLNIKLKEENSDIKKLKYPTKQEYEMGLKNLLYFLPPYEQVIKEVDNVINYNRKL